MKISTLIQNANSQELILVFGGFASHPSHFLHLTSNKNVSLVYDYERFDLRLDLGAFAKITLIAFSMGVCIASKILKDIHFTQKIALNGTNFGIDKSKGIHPIVFSKQVKKFEFFNFKQSLLRGRENLAKNFLFKDEKDLKIELQSLYDFALSTSNEAFIWDRIYSSNKDEIFPQNALKNSFSKLIFLDEPHFAFFHFKTWDAI